MRFLDYRATLAVATLGLAATPAFADLSAEDIWNNWKSVAGDTGQTISVGSESYSNGVLTLSDVTMSATMPDGQMTTTLDEVVITEQGDGSVALTMSEEIPFQIDGTDVDGETFAMEMTMRHNGMSMVASGDPGAMTYAFAAALVEVETTEFKVDDEAIAFDLSMAMNGTSGTYSLTGEDSMVADTSFIVGDFGMAISVKDPEEAVDFSMNFNMADLASTSTGTISPFAAGQDLSTLLRSGLTSAGQATMGPSTYTIAVDDPDTQFSLEGTTGSGVLDFAMDENGIRYGGGNTDIAMTLQMLSMPFPPFSLGISESAGEVRMPLIQTDESKDFGMKMDLQGLTLSDSAWGMFDPTGGLPRDPANLTLDVSGLGKWNVDITDPEATTALENAGGMPGVLDKIDINTLALSLLGAELTGDGAFAFNNSGPIPVPSGLVNLQLVGANGLIDTLISAGLLPEEQAMGARMMLGLFARPGEGADSLVSTIELQEDGSVLANGQRIR